VNGFRVLIAAVWYIGSGIKGSANSNACGIVVFTFVVGRGFC